jgi:hypothetical protein
MEINLELMGVGLYLIRIFYFNNYDDKINILFRFEEVISIHEKCIKTVWSINEIYAENVEKIFERSFFSIWIKFRAYTLKNCV